MSSCLFNKTDIFHVMEYQKDQLKQAFKNVTDSQLLENTKAVISGLVEEFGINVPVLDDAHKYVFTKETQVDVSHDPTRFITDRSRPFYVGGTEVTFVIPFTGDATLFSVQPTSFTLNPPYGEVHDGELHLVYPIANAEFNVEGEAERNIANVKRYLENMRPSAEQLRKELEQLAISLVVRRKEERGMHAQIVGGLKTPVRQIPPPGTAPIPTSIPVYPPARRRASKKKREDEWDVFISHATEDKEAIARPLADELRDRGLRVWYDEFSLRLGDSLRQSIDSGLARSLFGIAILSPNFFQKHWPQQELNGLANREVEGERVILPVWHNIDGAGVRSNSPILADRMAVSTSQGLEVVVQKIMEVVRPG